jgi:hypothetical protein
MSKGLKVIFETSRGERVERTLKAHWSNDVLQDLKAFHTNEVGEEMKKAVAQAIAEQLDFRFFIDVLTEFEKNAILNSKKKAK